MIVAFVGNPYPQIYILTNLHNHLFNIYENYPEIMKLCPHEPRNFLAVPINIDPHE